MQDEHRAVALLKQRGWTVALAESCTGGLMAARLTAVPGCSQVFGTGVVSYSWACKQQLLGVPRETLETYGAVSVETARAMAAGIRQRSDATLGVAITGEAGPQSAEGQPVGTVFVALASATEVLVDKLQLDGDRETIRQAAATHALDRLCRYIAADEPEEKGAVQW